MKAGSSGRKCLPSGPITDFRGGAPACIKGLLKVPASPQGGSTPDPVAGGSCGPSALRRPRDEPVPGKPAPRTSQHSFSPIIFLVAPPGRAGLGGKERCAFQRMVSRCFSSASGGPGDHLSGSLVPQRPSVCPPGPASGQQAWFRIVLLWSRNLCFVPSDTAS